VVTREADGYESVEGLTLIDQILDLGKVLLSFLSNFEGVYLLCLVIMAEGFHSFPSRTRPLSPPAPMVLGVKTPGRVGRCQAKQTHPILGWVFTIIRWKYKKIFHYLRKKLLTSYGSSVRMIDVVTNQSKK
jgi:hypothetical protein